MRLFDFEQTELRVEVAATRLDTLARRYAPYDRKFRQVRALQAIPGDMQQRLADFNQNDRKLRLGVVGQIKAGKSTLINALLFGGKEILAKAATPMTAALTFLTYAEKPRMTVKFFTREEWGNVIETAERDGEGEDIEAARWQVKQLQALGLEGCLGRADEVQTTERLEDLVGLLDEYVGANGRYSPAVASLTLHLPIPALREIDLVDTPGLNDPIPARSMRTRRELGLCDAVLLLSYSGRFLDASDLQLMAQHLPYEGVRHCVLLGTKLDSVLMDVRRSYPDIYQAIGGVYASLKRQAASVYQTYRPGVAPGSGLERAIESLHAPIFVSAMADLIYEHRDDWSEDERFLHDKINSLWPHTTLTPEEFKELGQLAAVEAQIREIAKEAEPIRAARLAELAEDGERKAHTLLTDMHEQATERLETLRHADLKRLQEHRSTLQERVEGVRMGTERLFHGVLVRVAQGRQEVLAELDGLRQRHSGLDEKRGTRTEHYTVQEERTGHRHNWFWGAVKFGKYTYTVDIERSRTVSYRYAEVDDALMQVEAFSSGASRAIERHLNDLIDHGRLRHDLLNTVVSGCDMRDADFDPRMIARAVEQTIVDMPLPRVSLADKDYTEEIARHFSGRVEGDQVGVLRTKTQLALGQILKDVERRMGAELGRIEDAVTSNREKFLDRVLTTMTADLESLQSEMANKEQEIRTYTELGELLRRDLAELRPPVRA